MVMDESQTYRTPTRIAVLSRYIHWRFYKEVASDIFLVCWDLVIYDQCVLWCLGRCAAWTLNRPDDAANRRTLTGNVKTFSGYELHRQWSFNMKWSSLKFVVSGGSRKIRCYPSARRWRGYSPLTTRPWINVHLILEWPLNWSMPKPTWADSRCLVHICIWQKGQWCI